MKKLFFFISLWSVAGPLGKSTVPYFPVEEWCFDEISEADFDYMALQLLIRFEGFRPNRYWDVNAWRIGYGTPAGDMKTTTRDIAMEELRKEYFRRKEEVRFFMGYVCEKGASPQAVAALTCLSFNIGFQGMCNSESIRQSLSDGECPPFHLFVKSKGKTLRGLVKRRKAEADLYNF